MVLENYAKGNLEKLPDILGDFKRSETSPG
jgi:hypothetical protein